MTRLGLLGLMGLALAVCGVGCPIQPDKTANQERIAALRGFGSPEELRTYLADQAKTQLGYRTGLFGLPMLGGGALGAAPVATDANATSNSAENGQDGAGSNDVFSTTNVQEAGVDESDVVKNDGQYIYVLDGNTIHIVQAAPPAGMTELSTINIDSSGDSLYLHGDKLVALSRSNIYYYADAPVFMGATSPASGAGSSSSTGEASPPVVGGNLSDGTQSAVTVINVADPAHPAVEATVRFEGNLASSRLIDNLLYLVLTTTPRLPGNTTPASVSAIPLENWIPKYETVAADGSTTTGDIAGWQDFYRPENPDGYGITAIVTLDITSPTTPFKSTAISANAGVIYASTKALYVTDTNYNYTSNTSRTDTVIHKLAYTQDGTAYRGSGLVPGRLLNQYSLGEYQNDLRVATTLETYQMTPGSSNGNVSSIGVSSQQQTNNVYVLREAADATLATIGQLEGLAPNEQIYSARFVGKRGFLVTFRRVDPLFTLDLSDPTQPKVAGQLKVPGYSDYIHPLDENHLLTIGKDAQDNGTFAWVQGIQLAIFDVTDSANPTQLFKELIGGRGSSSEANYNPKAFNYLKAIDALAFPADVYTVAGGGASYGQHEFTGLYVYHVTAADGFQLLGRIPTADGQPQSGCFYGYYGFTRGVFINDAVYSVTQRSVKASALDAVGTIIGQADLSSAPALTQDCFGVPNIVLPTGAGLE